MPASGSLALADDQTVAGAGEHRPHSRRAGQRDRRRDLHAVSGARQAAPPRGITTVPFASPSRSAITMAPGYRPP